MLNDKDMPLEPTTQSLETTIPEDNTLTNETPNTNQAENEQDKPEPLEPVADIIATAEVAEPTDLMPSQQAAEMTQIENEQANQPETYEPATEVPEPSADVIATTEVAQPVDSIPTKQFSVDYSHYTKEQFLHEIQQLAQEKNIKASHAQIKDMRLAFEVLINTEKALAFQEFISSGGEANDFDFKAPEEKDKFYKIYKQVQAAKAKQIAQLKEEIENNTKKKQDILDQLRKLLEAPDSPQNFDTFKQLQTQWREIGRINKEQVEEIGESYKALIKQFYDKQSIYSELRDLDRKHNLSKKIVICEKAEQLQHESSIKKAIQELNNLHQEFRTIGPVPKGEQKLIWQRLKTASDVIYQKKRNFLAQRTAENQENIAKKKVLIEKANPFKEFSTDKLIAWNEKTKELLAIQDEWEKIPYTDKEQSKDVNKDFWAIFKVFFNNKNAFLRDLDKQRSENYKLKIALCEQAEALAQDQESDGKAIADKLKDLQVQWKNIGAIPSRHKDNVYERFKKACDSFFEKRRNQVVSVEKQYELNLKAKQAICDKIDATENPEQVNAEALEGFIAEWKSIGFVPKKNMKEILQKFEIALYRYIERMPNVTPAQKNQIKFELQVKLSETGVDRDLGKKTGQKEALLRKKIAKLENDIATLRNNLGFFQNSRSAQAEKLRKDTNMQIAEAEAELTLLKNQIKLLQNLSK